MIVAGQGIVAKTFPQLVSNAMLYYVEKLTFLYISQYFLSHLIDVMRPQSVIRNFRWFLSHD